MGLLESMDRLMRDGFRVAVERASAPAAADLLWVSVVGDAEPAMDQMQDIQRALSGGAYLLVDVVSGNPDWDEGFRARLTRLEGVTLTKLRRTDPIFTGDIPGSRGFNSVAVGLRAALRDRFSKSGRCDLYEIRHGDRTVGVYSAYDLASGIGYHYFAGCRGPSPASARGLVMNVFLAAYAEKQSR